MRLPKILNKRSVAARTTILVLLIVAVIMLTAGIWQTYYTRKMVGAETHRQASRSMDGAIKVIDNRISNVETAVNTAASYAYMMAPDKKKSNTLLQRLIEANEDIAAVTLMYRADYFAEEGRYYAPTISRDPISGDLTEDEIGGPENDFCYIETDSNWVYTNKLDRGYWCLPYIDSMSTKRAMVTYSVPLHDQKGETYAILCADVDLRWVQNVVESAKPYDYSKVFVIGRDSQYVCHPNPQWVQSINAITQVRKNQNKAMRRLTDKMLRWERGADTIDALSLYETSEPEEPEPSVVFYAPVSKVQWSVCFTVPQEKVMELPNKLDYHMRALIVILLLAIAVMLRYIIRTQLLPLKDLSVSASKVAQGDFHASLPVIHTEDEIRALRDSFENMQISLTEYMDQLKKTTASKAQIEGELHVATDIQMAMLPRMAEQCLLDRIDIYGTLKPAKAVGGDLFDYCVNGHLLYFCIGDVSGKGVPAALIMAVTQTLFRTISTHETSPAAIVSQINESLTKSNDSNMFVTLFVGVLNMTDGHLDYCNAGHDSPLLKGNRGIGLLPCDANVPAGVVADWTFSDQSTTIDKGTTILLYTDGLTEAENIRHEQFQEDRLHEVAKQSVSHPRDMIEQMTAAVHDFVGEAEQSDDLTMLAIRLRDN